MSDIVYNREIYWEVLASYSRLMRKKCDSLYTMRGKEQAFVEAANLIYEIAAKASEYVWVQFQGADMFHYPVPEDLSRPTAVYRWRLYDRNKRLEGHVNQQEVYMDKYRDMGLEDREIASLAEVPLAAWYRLLHLDSPPEGWLMEGLEQVRNPRLLELVGKKGYDTRKILRWRHKLVEV